MMTSQSKIKLGTVLAVEFFLILWVLMVLSLNLTGQAATHLKKGCEFTGMLQSTWGDMTLVQKGDEVKGTFSYEGGLISGFIDESTLKGRWSKAPTYTEPFDAGQIEMKMNEKCTEVVGKWRYGESGKWMHNWSGKWMEEKEFIASEVSHPLLWTDKNNIQPGEEFTVHFMTAGNYSIDAWIGIIPSEVPHGNISVNEENAVTRAYLFNRAEGEVIFYAPVEEGTYDLRLFDAGDNGKEVFSTTIYIQALPQVKDIMIPMI